MVTFLIYLITAVFVICSLLLTVVVLMQRPRSEGLGAAFGSGMTDSLFGAQTSDVLTKATIWLAGIFFVCTLSLAILYAHRAPKAFSNESLLNPTPHVEVTEPAAGTTPAAPAPETAPAAPQPAN